MATDALDAGYAEDAIVAYDTEEVPLVPLPVKHCGVTDVRPVPARAMGGRTYSLNTTTPVKIAGHDGRRKHIQLIAMDFGNTSHGVRIGNSANEAAGGLGFLLPTVQAGMGAPLVIDSMGELWAVADTASCVLSVLPENHI